MTTTPELDLIDELIAQTPVLGTDAVRREVPR